MTLDWKAEISKMVLIKKTIFDLDKNGLWTFHLPKVAATESEIAKVESELGFDLDKYYKQFLLNANGWDGFYQNADLFGTSDLVLGKKKQYALDILNQCCLENFECELSNLLPICVTQTDIDVFCLNKTQGTIIWFAGGEIDHFKNFEEFFLAMMDYNREEVKYLKSSLH